MLDSSLTPYLTKVRHEIERSIKRMEVATYPCREGGGMNNNEGYPIRPIVEFPHLGLVETRRIQHSAREYCLLESSKNSVRLSFAFKQQHSADAIDRTILEKYVRFFQQRAPIYDILRRKPVVVLVGVASSSENNSNSNSSTTQSPEFTDLPVYSISFLVTNHHVQKYGGETVVATIMNFASRVDKECSHVKISINARARFVAAEFLKSF